jgi:hypothetical protein
MNSPELVTRWGVLDVADVVVLGIARLNADGAGVHPLGPVLLHDHLDAAAGGEASFAGCDGDRPDRLAADADDHRCLGTSIAVTTEGPMVKSMVRLVAPQTPTPAFTPRVAISTVTLVPAGQ